MLYVKIGGDNPISVQTMTNTITADAKQTIAQVKNVQRQGLGRVSCPDTIALSRWKKYVNQSSSNSCWYTLLRKGPLAEAGRMFAY